MSTYGTAMVIDVAAGGDVAGVQSRLLALEDADVYVIDGPAGWHRFSTYTREVEITKDISGLLELAGRSRAAVAEDLDEFGAEWSVLSNHDGQVEILHRHYILNADPAAPDEVSVAISDLGDDDPRIENVDGPDAATAAARAIRPRSGGDARGRRPSRPGLAKARRRRRTISVVGRPRVAVAP